ncbi:MAG: hypothetical protein PF795_15875 [Kiritimatiellae bacterium]|nr:hypothetical protein [Kiritimatiellia bacterium]
MKESSKNAFLFAANGIISFLFVIGVAAFNMKSLPVKVDFITVLSYLPAISGGEILISLILSGLTFAALYLRMRLSRRRFLKILMECASIAILAFLAVSLNSTSTQGVFAFLPDGLNTTYRLLMNSLTEKEWSADTWVLQACMMWWMFLWCALLISDTFLGAQIPTPLSEPRSSVRTE